MAPIDHLMCVVPDLNSGIDELEEVSEVEVLPGHGAVAARLTTPRGPIEL